MAIVVPVVSTGGVANLCTAQTGTGVTTNVADRGAIGGPVAVLRIVTTVGATPTCTYAVEGSPDNTTFVAAPISLVATPETLSVATFAITTATTTFVILRANAMWRYVRVTLSANTNVTSTIDLLV